MARDTDCVRRRSVLGAAGSVAVAGFAATGSAAAGHFTVGQPAVLTIDYQSFDRACPRGTQGDEFREGERVVVFDTCTPDSDHYDEFVLVDTNDPLDHRRGWVRHGVLRDP